MNTQKRFVLRTETLTTCTIGKLYLEKPIGDEFPACGGAEREFLCRTIELPWLDNKPYISCIPAGEYIIRPCNSPTKGKVYYIESEFDGVVGYDTGTRTHCLFHIANRPSELAGCVAVGSSTGVLADEMAVFNSGITFRSLMRLFDGFDYRLRIERF